MSAGTKPLWVLAKDSARWELKEGTNIVGRKQKDPSLPVPDVALEVSIIPFKTVNSTKINKKLATALERYDLAVGDELKFGPEGPFRLLEQTGTVKPAPIGVPIVTGSAGPQFGSTSGAGGFGLGGGLQERKQKRAADEKISLTSGDAKFLADQRVRERLGEEGALKRHAEILRETDNNRKKVEELNRRRIELEAVLAAKKARCEALEKDVMELEGQKKKFDAEVYQTRESLTKTNSFQKALESFATEVNRKIGQMQSVASEKSQVLKDLSKKEFVRLYDKESKSVQELREKFITLAKEIENQRSKLRVRPNRNSGLGGESDHSDHLSTIAEQQYEELSLAKKQIIEYEAREAASQHRWNSLIKEHVSKDDRIKGLKLQIERNLDNLQVLMMDHDGRMFELSKKIYEVIGISGNQAQKDAAFFLTQQIPLVQEERRELVMENEQFYLTNQEIIVDLERIKADIDRLKVLVDPNLDLDSASQSEVLAHFKDKLDRVTERIEQEKAAERVSVLSDLRNSLERIEIQTAKEFERKKFLQQRMSDLMREKPFSDRQSIVQFFSALVESKEEHVNKLAKALEGTQQKKKEQERQLQQMRDLVRQKEVTLEDLKKKQQNFSAAVIEGERNGISH